MPGFSYKLDKSDRMTIFHHKRAVTTLGPKAAIRLENQLLKADEAEQQRLMAAATGNYKRGNERA
jgi:recombinational DNA repair protein RecR